MVTKLPVQIFTCLLLACVAVPVSAESVVRSGETVSVAADEVVTGDFYTAASVINISGTVTEDIVAAGGKVTLNGVAEQDVLLLAGAVDIHGVVNEDVRVIAGEVVLAEPIAGDVFVFGGKLEVLSSATIGGDLLFFGGEAKVEGDVAGDIFGYAGELRVDALVGGDVSVTADMLVLGDRANVAGSVLYTSPQLVIRSQNAAVAGELVRTEPVVPAASSAVQAVVLPVLILLFTALAWFLLARRSFARVTELALRSVSRSVILGVIVLIGVPFAASVLMASVIGAQVGLVLLMLYLLVLLLGAAMIVPITGQLVQVAFIPSNQTFSLLTLLLGAVAVGVLALLPVIGLFILLGLLLVGVGATSDVISKGVRR